MAKCFNSLAKSSIAPQMDAPRTVSRLAGRPRSQQMMSPVPRLMSLNFDDILPPLRDPRRSTGLLRPAGRMGERGQHAAPMMVLPPRGSLSLERSLVESALGGAAEESPEALLDYVMTRTHYAAAAAVNKARRRRKRRKPAAAGGPGAAAAAVAGTPGPGPPPARAAGGAHVLRVHEQLAAELSLRDPDEYGGRAAPGSGSGATSPGPAAPLRARRVPYIQLDPSLRPPPGPPPPLEAESPTSPSDETMEVRQPQQRVGLDRLSSVPKRVKSSTVASRSLSDLSIAAPQAARVAMPLHAVPLRLGDVRFHCGGQMLVLLDCHSCSSCCTVTVFCASLLLQLLHTQSESDCHSDSG